MTRAFGRAQLALAALAFLAGVQLALVARAMAAQDRARRQALRALHEAGERLERADSMLAEQRTFHAPQEGPAEVVPLMPPGDDGATPWAVAPEHPARGEEPPGA